MSRPPKGIQVVDHFLTVAYYEHFDDLALYEVIAAEIDRQQVPSLKMKRVDLNEGGGLSDQREYLRIKRENIVFDFCAAPIGVHHFFSYRAYCLPVEVKWYHILGVLTFFGGVFWLFEHFVGMLAAYIAVSGTAAISFAAMKSAVGTGIRDLDQTLIDTPCLGRIYQRWFRSQTFFRDDTRSVYTTLVSGIVKAKVEEVIAAKGKVLRKEMSYSPLLYDLYKVKDIEPEPAGAA